MHTISQHQLRDQSGEVMRQISAGASFRITSKGEPIAILTPVGSAAHLDDLILREGSQEMSFPAGVHVDMTSDEALAELRGHR